MKYFDKTSDKMTMQEKFEYVKNHFTYFTMSSWNGDENIANNVKLYNLGLTSEQFDFALDFLFNEDTSFCFWDDVRLLIHDSGLTAFFNGRTDGYIVLGREHSIYWEIYSFDSYEEAIATECERIEELGGIRFYNKQIEKDFLLIRKFDRLCDDIRGLLIYYCNNYELGDEKYTIEQTRKILVPKGAEK